MANCLLRILEHTPAWEMHVFLRVNNIPYIADYTTERVGLGKTLPVAIGSNIIVEDLEGIQHYLLKHSEENQAYNDSDDQLIEEIIQRYRELTWTLRRKSFVGKMEALKEVNSFKLIQEYLWDYDGKFATGNEEELISSLRDLYDKLEMKLESTMAFYDETATIPASTLLVDSPKSPKSKLFNPSKMSLALLLGHFARLLSDENDAIYKIFNERPSMKKYFYDTMRSLFDYNAKNTTTDNVLLQRSLEMLLYNPALQYPNYKELYHVLEHRLQVYQEHNINSPSLDSVISSFFTSEIVDTDSQYVFDLPDAQRSYFLFPANNSEGFKASWQMLAVGAAITGYFIYSKYSKK